MARVPPVRLRTLNDAPTRGDREVVLYWMTASRRARFNFALDRAVWHAKHLGKPLVVLEPLRVGYPWASDRMHAFVLQGMRDNAAAFARSPVLYHPYVEPEPGHGQGLLEAWASVSAVVVTDDWPCFFLPRMQAAAARKLDVSLEAVDSAGLYPMRSTERVFERAVDFRRHLQKCLLEALEAFPSARPFAGDALAPAGSLPAKIAGRWAAADLELLQGGSSALARLPIDHTVSPAPFEGGSRAAARRWRTFLDHRLDGYGEGRNHPDEESASGLSPWLHFGHLSVHEMFRALAKREDWHPGKTAPRATASRSGWWGMSTAAESFIDEFVTWRELGLNRVSHRDDYDHFASLPEWARRTMDTHRADPRTHVYLLAAFEASETHDEVWNAAQRELVTTGRMHNYLRMLWGKMIYAWSRSPEEALETMIHLNNKYAVDGRDPNSYSGIFWVLGRYDRPWGPERPVFGTLRYMTSDSTRRKLRMKRYLERFGRQSTLL